MIGSRVTIRLTAAVSLLMAGCHASPWSSNQRPAPGASVPAAPAVAAAPAAAATAPTNPAAPAAQPSPAVDAQALQQVIAEVQQASALDPASRDRLMQDLQQTDPSLWPLVVQQFRAALAYRQQSEQRRMAGGPPNAAADRVAQRPLVPGPGGPAGPATPSQQAPLQPTAVQQSPTQPLSAQPSAPPVQPNGGDARPAPAASVPNANPAPDAAPPREAPRSEGPQAAAPAASAPAKGTAGEVQQASYTAEAPGDWHAQLAAAIRAREAELSGPVKTPEDEARQAQLRLLYLAAGRRDDALRAIPSAAPPVQNFWSEQCYGLSTLLDTQRTPDASRRASEARQHLSDALAKLGETCPLAVKNVAFCNKIQSYGCIKPFEKYEFSPGQNVLLYAEVENLGTETTAQGVHTSLRSSYQIFDARGQRVADDEFTTTEEYCRNPRRDYFIGYDFRLPERIYAGKHTLQLTIEDLKSHKLGQSSIEFTIKKPERDAPR